MDDGDWDLMSIVRSCKATNFSNPTVIFETSPPPQTPITITTTNNIIPTQNTTPSYFSDITVTQENNQGVTPLKPTDFIDLEKLRINFNQNNILPIPTTVIPNPTTSSPISITTTPTTPATTIPTFIATAPFHCVYNHPSVPQQPTTQHNQLPILLPQTPITITTTKNIIPPQNTTPSCFSDFTVTQENNQGVTPLKPTNFIDLEKLRINFNHNNILHISTTVIPNPTTSSPISITTTPTTPATTIPTFIGTAPFHCAYNHPSVLQQPTRQNNQIPILLPQTPITITTTLQNTTQSYLNNFTDIQENNSILIPSFKPTDFIDLEKFRFNFNHNNTLQIPTTIIPNSTTIRTPTTSIQNIIPTTTFSPISTTTIPALSTTTNLTQIPTVHFDRAYNHPSIRQQPPRQHNQLPNLQPRTNSRVLPNIYPQHPKCKSRKRKNYDQVSLVCHVKKENLSEDRWVWRKYGQKSIKGSPHPRNYYNCSTSKDCSAKKLLEKSKTIENTYVVTYIGVHNHEKPLVNRNFRRWSYLSSQSSQMGE